ncbi:MAG: class I SAM-dependent methyltransferase [Nitrospirae bacterium]|nr:class I SAM-dependent methyltransferase [Nitrospirota bacterium]
MTEHHDHSQMTPASLLVESLPLLPKGGRALDVAMGKGRNALYLAERGFQVEGVEIDAEAVRVCEEEARRRNVTVNATTADLTRFQIPKETYDVIVCFYYLQRDLIPQMREGLKPGGVIVYETFLIDQHLKTGKPGRREFCFEQNELLHLFLQGFRVLSYREGFVSEDRASASLVARKAAGRYAGKTGRHLPCNPSGISL